VIFHLYFLLLSPIFPFWKAVYLLPCTDNHTVVAHFVKTVPFLNNFTISSIMSATVFYVHIDIFKNFKCIILRYLVKAFYCNFGM